MLNKKQRSLMFIGLSVTGAVLILIVLLFYGKELKFSKYHDPLNRITINYPSDWSYSENMPGALVFFGSPDENELDIYKENVSIIRQDISKNTISLSDYTNIAIDQMKAVFGKYFVLLYSKPSILGGKSGHKIIFRTKHPQGDVKMMVVWTIKNNIAYQISYAALEENFNKFLWKVKWMLWNFKILE